MSKSNKLCHPERNLSRAKRETNGVEGPLPPPHGLGSRKAFSLCRRYRENSLRLHRMLRWSRGSFDSVHAGAPSEGVGRTLLSAALAFDLAVDPGSRRQHPNITKMRLPGFVKPSEPTTESCAKLTPHHRSGRVHSRRLSRLPPSRSPRAQSLP
jgi:hypothetical protein